MAHPRKLVRHAIRDLLLGQTVAGARVTATKVEPHRPGQLPAISVYTMNEPVRDATTGAPRELTRDVEAQLVGWIVVDGSAADPMDPIDDFAEQIEAVMDADRFLAGTAFDSVLTDTEIEILKEGGADPLVGRLTLTYTVTYHTVPGAVSPTNDYLRTGATTKITGAGDDNTVSDLFDQQP
jgi:hypothetical protein